LSARRLVFAVSKRWVRGHCSISQGLFRLAGTRGHFCVGEAKIMVLNRNIFRVFDQSMPAAAGNLTTRFASMQDDVAIFLKRNFLKQINMISCVQMSA
jgi:hypothetical protein